MADQKVNCEKRLGGHEVSPSAYIVWFDWLRFVAALMVVLGHARGGIWVEWGLLDPSSKSVFSAAFFVATRTGTEWVIVFFCLSGFLVGGRVIERAQQHNFSLQQYAIDRVCRIWIPFIPALIWSGCVALIVGKSATISEFISTLLGFAGILTNAFGENYPVWSLTYEIWFYILAGALGTLAVTRGKAQLSALSVMIVALALFSQLSWVFLASWLFAAIAFWAAKFRDLTVLWPIGLIMAIVGTTGSQLASASSSFELGTEIRLYFSRDICFLILSAGIALTLPALAKVSLRTSEISRHAKVGAFLASFSYTMYLVHYPFMYLWQWMFPGLYTEISIESVSMYFAKVIAAVIFSWLFYLPFERKTVKVRQKMKLWLSRSENKKFDQ